MNKKEATELANKGKIAVQNARDTDHLLEGANTPAAKIWEKRADLTASLFSDILDVPGFTQYARSNPEMDKFLKDALRRMSELR